MAAASTIQNKKAELFQILLDRIRQPVMQLPRTPLRAHTIAQRAQAFTAPQTPPVCRPWERCAHPSFWHLLIYRRKCLVHISYRFGAKAGILKARLGTPTLTPGAT